MSYIAPASPAGAIEPAIKERILSRMYDYREGYMTAAIASGISRNRAHVALKTDKDLAEHVAQAREGIAEHLVEELVDIADTANPENAAAISVRIKTRQWVIEKVLPRFRPQKADTNVAVYNDNRQVLVTPEKLAELRDRLQKLQLDQDSETYLTTDSNGTPSDQS